MAKRAFSSVFVLYDFSETAQTALSWAQGLAKTFGSHLKVLHTIPDWINFGHTGDLKKLAAIEIKDEVDDPSIEIEVLEGHVVERLSRAIEAQGPDLVVLGTQGRTGLMHVLMGSVAEKLVRHSPSPVATVRPPIAWPPKIMILPLAFDESAEEALWFASEWKRTLPSLILHAVHVIVPPIPMSLSPDVVAGFEAFDPQAAKASAEKQLQEILSRHAKLDALPHVAIGHPADSICEMAKRQKADLILVPTHGRTGIGRFFLGSVAEHIVRYAPCSVMTFSPRKEKCSCD